MSNMIADGVAHLQTRLQTHAAVSIVYRRSTLHVTLTAAPGSSLLRLTSPKGWVQIVRTDADFIFPAADLILGGNVVEPQRGDLIDRTWPDGITRRYQVLSPGGEEPEWRYSDSNRVALRVHTKYIGVI